MSSLSLQEAVSCHAVRHVETKTCHSAQLLYHEACQTARLHNVANGIRQALVQPGTPRPTAALLADSSSACREIPRIVNSRKVRYRVCNSLPFVRNLSQINPTGTLPCSPTFFIRHILPCLGTDQMARMRLSACTLARTSWHGCSSQPAHWHGCSSQPAHSLSHVSRTPST
jgi:hypothetical protein